MQAPPDNNMITVTLESIVPDPENLRELFDEVEIDALAENLLELGQLDPIQIFDDRHDGKYDLYDGERRLRAAKKAEIPNLLAIIVPRPPETEILCKKVSRALQSQKLTAQEEVKAIENALTALGVRDDPTGWTQAARKLGIDGGRLRDRMRIPTLAPKVRQAFDRDELDLSAAQALGRLDDPKRQEEVAQFIQDNHLSTRFVGTTLIKHLLKAPDTPIMEVLAVAESEHGGTTTLASPTVDKVANLMQEALSSLRKARGQLISIGREDLLGQLLDRGDIHGARSLIEEVGRLGAICGSFSKVARGSADPTATVINASLLPAQETDISS